MVDATANVGPLQGVRVLDLGTGMAAPFAAKILGDLGADVVKVESPSVVDPARRAGPFPAGSADPEASGAHLYVNSSKRSALLEQPDVLKLVPHYDVVIADGPESDLAAAGLGLGALRAVNPRVVLSTVSGFGSAGPYRDYRAPHLVLSALSGQAVGCGLPEREPLQAPGALHELAAGAYAAVATLAAVLGRDRHGRGEHVDVSAFESSVTLALLPTLTWEYFGIVPERRSDRATGPSFNLPTAEGHVGADVLTQAHWENMLAFLGREDLIGVEHFDDPVERFARSDEVRDVLVAALAERRAAEVFHEAQLWRVPFGLVVSPAQVLELDQHRERAFFETVEHPVAGELPLARPPFLMSATPSRPRRAPLRGEHTAEVLTEAAALGAPSPTPSEPEGATAGDRASTPAPLAGMRIVDLTMFMSGPLTTLFAADLGADVIKVESRQRVDGWRAAGRGEVRPWETAHCFNWINRSKRGITLDLNDPRGAELLRRLVSGADAVVENYTPRVMENFGLTYAALSEVRPDLVMLSMPGFGATGPWRDYAAFAWTTEQLGGLCHLTGYEDGPPLFSNTTGGDPLAGLFGGVALMAALLHRQRTGEGQLIDLSQVETATMFIGDQLLEPVLAGRDPARRGNRHPTMVPHGMYRCGDREWVAVACAGETDRAALADLVGVGQPADPTELDSAVAAWCERGDAGALWHELQRAGVPAGRVMNGRDLLEDPQLAARGFHLEQDRPEVGPKRYTAQPFRFADATLPAPTPAPHLGESTREVLRELAGCTDAELDALERDEVIGTDPLGW